MTLEQLNTLSDEELVRLYQQGSENAGAVLTVRYRKAILPHLLRPFHIVGLDSSDLEQEAVITLSQAAESYRPEQESLFLTFASHCIRNRIYDLIRLSRNGKNAALNESISLEDLQYPEDEESGEPSGATSAQLPSYPSAEEQVMSWMILQGRLGHLWKALSPLERIVLKWYLEGYSYREIALCSNRSEKSVDATLQRIRAKAKQIAQEEDT